MIKGKLDSNFDLCTGCAICTLVCSRKVTGGYNPRFSLLWLEEKMEGLVSDPVVCNQCDNAFCEQVCPVSAIERKNDNDIPLVNSEKCIGCGRCRDYCPRGVIILYDKKAIKCDLCQGAPLCVQHCPTGALKLIKKENQEEAAHSFEKRGESDAAL